MLALVRVQGGVLVHCFMGISRSTTVLAAYLMDHENYSAKQAVSQVSLLVSLLWLLWTLSPSSGPSLSPCILHYPSSCATRYTSLSLAFSVSSFSLSVSLFLPSPLHRTHIEDGEDHNSHTDSESADDCTAEPRFYATT